MFVQEFSGFKEKEQQLANLVMKSEILVNEGSPKEGFMDFFDQNGQYKNDALVLYKKNVPSNLFSLVLQVSPPLFFPFCTVSNTADVLCFKVVFVCCGPY